MSMRMPAAVLSLTLHMLRASARRQLVVLAAGSLLLGLLGHAVLASASREMALLGVAVLVPVLLAASIRAARGERIDAAAAQMLLRSAPRVVSQSCLAVAPLLVAAALVAAASLLHPLLALMLVPVAFCVAAIVAAPTLLAVAAVGHGDDSWLPRRAWRMLGGRVWLLAGLTLAGGVAVGFAVLPLAFAGVLLVTLPPPLSTVGLGLAPGAVVVLLGCLTLALWRSLGGVDAAEASPGAAEQPCQAGPWEIVLEPGAAWGTWLQLPRATLLDVHLSWAAGPAPLLRTCSADGVWSHPVEALLPGALLQLPVPAGAVYVQVEGRSTTPQVVLLQAAAAVAAA